MLGRLESLEDPLTLAHWEMGVLRTVVQPLVASVFGRGQHPLDGRHVAGELVGDNYPRRTASCCEDAAQERHGSLLIPPLLDQNVQHEPILIDCPPQPVLLSSDLQLHLVNVPLVGWPKPPAAQVLGICRPELAAPEADRLVADLDASLGEQLFDVPDGSS
jgi:hypothetical protein